jgi:Zn-dependent protease with chaperone function
MSMHLISQIRRSPHVAFSTLCLITVLSGYFYTYTNSVISKQVSIIFLSLSVAVWVYFCIRQLARMIRIRILMKKYNSSYEIPDYEEMQKMVKEMRVKLDKKHPFVVKIGLDNAYYDPMGGRIGLGDVLLNRLVGQESMALVGHELTHIKKNHFIKQFVLLFILYIPLGITLRREPDLIFCAVWIALFLMLFPYVSRKFEFEADAGAADKSSPEVIISMLKKTGTEEHWGRETVTHPSINSRIKRLHKHKRK